MVATRRPRGRGEERVHQRPVREGGTRNPGTFLRTAAHPVDEVLIPSTTPTGGHDPLDLTSQVVEGGWRGFGRRAKRAREDGLDLRDMEGRVGPGMGRETEADGRRAEDGDNLIGASETW